jgi:hypothetical protein
MKNTAAAVSPVLELRYAGPSGVTSGLTPDLQCPRELGRKPGRTPPHGHAPVSCFGQVLDRGEVAQLGSHSELMEEGGLYKTMWARQQDAGEPAAAGAGCLGRCRHVACCRAAWEARLRW